MMRERKVVVAGLWALLGIGGLFLLSVVRLGAHGLEVVTSGLTTLEGLALVVIAGALFYGEGVRAIQRRWIPRVLRRADELGTEPRLRYLLLAPLYAMSLVGAPPRDLRRSWVLTATIVVAIAVVRRVP